MAELRFKVKADYEELGRLRAEIQKLKADLKNTGKNTDTEAVKSMESQLAMLTKQYEAMTKRIAEAEAQYDMLAKKMTERAKDVAKAQQVISDAAANPPAPDTAELPATDTSLETQAKAYDDLKKEIDSIAGSKANLIKQMLDEQNAIRLINAELKQINVEQKTNGKQTQAQKERVTQLNESLLTHKQALSEVRQSLTNYVKLENAASGSMEELSQSLGRMRMVYRTLTEEERNSPFGKELLASIQQADAKIKELDATIGNHQRNVGNYGQAWNGLGNSIQQLARELPALANGPRVFFSAISNNLPILADEIKRARTEYDEMVKKGEKGVPVWKQIGASILSWQTALTVGITLLTMYGDKIVEWGKGLFEGSKAINNAERTTREFNKAMDEGGESAARTVVELKVMEKIAKDVTRSETERNNAARKVLETLGETVNATNIAKVTNGEYADSVNQATKALIKQAQAQATMEKLQDKYSKVIRKQNRLARAEEKGVTIWDKLRAGARSGILADAGVEAVTGQDVLNQRLDRLRKRAEDAQEDFDSWATEFLDNFTFDDMEGKTPDASLKNFFAESLAEIARITQMEADAMRDRARSAKDMEFTVEQARIDAMKEGYQRDKAQRELNFRQELEQLERQKDDYIRQVVEQEKAIFEARENQRAKESKEYVKQTFDTEAATKRVTETDPVVQQYTQVVEYTVKKQETESARQDAAAWRDSMNAYLREYGDYEGKKLAITQEYEAKIAETMDIWEKGLLAQKMKEELAELDVEANKTTNAIAQLFGDMRDKSVKELDSIAEKGTEALEFLKSGKWDSSKGIELGITKETFDVWSKSPEKLKAIMDALLGVQQASDQLRNPIDKVIDGFKDLFNAAGDKNKLNEAFAVIQQGVNELTGAIGFASDALANMADATGSKWMEKASEGIDNAMNVVNQTMAGADAGKAFGPWGMAIGAAVGLASSLVTEITKAKDAVHDVEIERLAKETATLEKSYDMLGKSIEKAFSADASNLIEQQNTLLEQKKANIKLMIAEEQAKKKVDESQVEAWKEQLEEIDETIQNNKESAVEAITGQDIMSAIDSFANAYADAWANGEDAASASVKATRNMLRTSLTEFLKGQLSDEVEAFNKKLADVMRDGIMEPWEEAQLDALREKMDKEAQKYYEQTSKYWEDETGTGTESQQSASRKGYETLSEDTGNELVGRALAQYESNLRMEATMAEVRDMVSLLVDAKTAGAESSLRDIASESRMIIADSYLELLRIRENTEAIIKPIRNLSSKIDRWDDKIMGL